MSRKEKLFSKISTNTKNVTLDDLVRLMGYYGFTYRKSNEGYFFKHEKLINRILPNVPIPHGSGKSGRKVKQHYVKNCLNAIDLLNIES